MKVSNNDPFDLNLCLRGLRMLTCQLYSDVYEYAYILTFKRSMKMYRKEFFDPDEAPIEDLDFFRNTGDLYVTNCIEAFTKLVSFYQSLTLRLGVDEEEELQNETVILESKRYEPYYLIYKNSKSYKKLRLYYERLLVESINSLNTYACAITAQKYKIPLVLKRQFDLPEEECFRLLNTDDNDVDLIIGLIIGLKAVLADLRVIMDDHLKKTVARRRRPAE